MTLRLSTLIAPAAIALAAVAGCYTGSPIDTNLEGVDPTTTDDPTVPNVDGGKKTTNGTGKGLPCDVADVMTSCTGCHGTRPSGGAPNRLVSYEDLASGSITEPGKTIAAECVERMKSSSRPMPPDGPLNNAAIAVLQRWISAGLPRGSCIQTPPTPAEETPPNTPPPPPNTPPPPNAPPPEPVSVCTSGIIDPPELHPGSTMKPGNSCNNCHETPWAIAGTVYPTLHEPNDCHGLAGVTVEITDVTGRVITLTSNSTGNFRLAGTIAAPYHARVIRNGVEHRMTAAQTEGSCNKCHTEQGGDAPGRIMPL